MITGFTEGLCFSMKIKQLVHHYMQILQRM